MFEINKRENKLHLRDTFGGIYPTSISCEKLITMDWCDIPISITQRSWRRRGRQLGWCFHYGSDNDDGDDMVIVIKRKLISNLCIFKWLWWHYSVTYSFPHRIDVEKWHKIDEEWLTINCLGPLNAQFVLSLQSIGLGLASRFAVYYCNSWWQAWRESTEHEKPFWIGCLVS